MKKVITSVLDALALFADLPKPAMILFGIGVAVGAGGGASLALKFFT